MFEVEGETVRPGLDSRDNSASQAGDGEVRYRVGVMEVVAAELVCLQGDLVAGFCAQATPSKR